jgi:hypothetical protein
MTAVYRLKVRSDVAANWTAVNPVLLSGEPGIEYDTGKIKFGDGTSTWTNLPYAAVKPSEVNSLISSSISSASLETQSGATQKATAAETAAIASSRSYTDSSVQSASQSATTALSSHNSSTLSVHGIADTSQLETKSGAQGKADFAQTAAIASARTYTDTSVAGLIDSAPTLLNTLNELAAAINDDSNFATTVATSISNSVATAKTEMTTYTDTQVQSAISTAATDASTKSTNALNSSKSYTDTTVSAAASVASTATSTVGGLLSTHTSATQNVHGIADTSALETSTGAQSKATAALTSANTYTDSSVASATSSLQSSINSAVTAAATDATTKANGALTSANSYTDSAVSGVVGAAPANLNTLVELAAAINNDPNVYTTLQSALNGKQPLDGDLTAISSLTGSGLLKKTGTDSWSLDSSNYLTGNQSITLTGDASGSGSTSIALTLANTAVTAGQYGAASSVPQVTVDSKGRVTAASSVPIAIAQSAVSGLTTDLAAKANLSSPTFTGTPSAPTADSSSNSTQIATTQFVTQKISSVVAAAPAALDTLNELAAALGNDANFASSVTTALSGKQPLDADLTAIAALTGTSGLLKKTAANSWSLDTTNYLTGNQSITVSGDATGSGTTGIALTLANSGVTAGTYNNVASEVRPFTVDAKGRITATGTAVPIAVAQSAVTNLTTDLAAKASLASPTFTGTPLSPTAAADTNTTQVATTAFVLGQASGVSPQGLGTAAVGTATRWARADHVHPTTGLGLTSGTLAQFAATTSAQLASTISDETGSGSLVFATSPTLTGVTVSSGGLTVSGGGVTLAAGNVLNAPVVTNAQTASYTLALTDAGRLVEMNSASALTLTVAPDSSVNFAVGAQIQLLRVGTGNVTVAAGSGVTVNATPALTLRAQWSGATLTKRAANVWVLNGDLG